jgi:hypothetical protein
MFQNLKLKVIHEFLIARIALAVELAPLFTVDHLKADNSLTGRQKYD